MRVAIHQPHYLPWLRYFEKIARSDLFIVLDDAQFAKNDWQNRNRVKAAGRPVVLTVPVCHRLGQRLDEVCIDNTGHWRRKHWETIRQHYARAPFFADYAPGLEAIYAQAWDRLDALNLHMLRFFCDALGIATPLVRASTLNVPGNASARLVALVRAVGGDTYYSGRHAAETYLDRALFGAADIRIDLQDWRAPEYPQLHGAFVPDLAIVDLLMNRGPDSLRILMEGRV